MPAMLMPMLTLVMVQTVPGPPGDEAAAAPRVTAERRCVRGSDEIVVCSRGDADRLRPVAPLPVRSRIPVARVALSPHAAASAEGDYRGEWLGSALMARVKIDF